MSGPGFDLTVQHRDPKTGRIIRENPYSMHVSKEHGTIFTRAGVQYHPDGTRVHPEPAKAATPIATAASALGKKNKWAEAEAKDAAKRENVDGDGINE